MVKGNIFLFGMKLAISIFFVFLSCMSIIKLKSDFTSVFFGVVFLFIAVEQMIGSDNSV